MRGGRQMRQMRGGRQMRQMRGGRQMRQMRRGRQICCGSPHFLLHGSSAEILHEKSWPWSQSIDFGGKRVNAFTMR